MPKPRLILASASPRRAKLLRQLRDSFEVRPCPLEEPEHRPADVSPAAWAESLAHFKARVVAETAPGCWVIGADTVVDCGGEILGQPRDQADARRMLELQMGRASDVITGVALLLFDGQGYRHILGHDVTRVWMRSSREAMETYLQSGDWAGKAGAYGIQDVGDALVERIEGSFSNVVGLPIELLGRLLARAGAELQA